MFEDLQRQFPDRDDLATKIADCLWAVGRNRKAFEMLEHALRAREPAPEVALRMRFLQLHALRRARNEVVGRVWATTEKCHRVFSETVELAGGSDTAGSDVPHLHRVRPHVMNELYVLSKDLPVEPAAVGRYERTEAEVRSGYREAASLGGVANASYRDLHERDARGDLDSRERDRLVEFADSIGNQNVAYRASLLAESLPSVLEALSDTGRVQYPLSYALKTAAQAVIRWLQFRRNSPTSRS
jgi:hypothetical protein